MPASSTTEPLRQEKTNLYKEAPTVGTLLSAFGAGYIAPVEGLRVGQMVGQLCKVHLWSELVRALQNDHVDAFDLLAFHREFIVLST